MRHYHLDPDSPIVQQSQNCPVTRKKFEAGDDVVECDNGHIFLAKSWDYLDGKCGVCHPDSAAETKTPGGIKTKPEVKSRPDSGKESETRRPEKAKPQPVPPPVVQTVPRKSLPIWIASLLIGGVILMVILVCVGSLWAVSNLSGEETATFTPIPVSQATVQNNTPTKSPATKLPTPTKIPSVTLQTSGQDRLPAAPSPTKTSRPTRTPIPTKRENFGIIVTEGGRLNARLGPSVGYGIVTYLENGDKVTILRRTPTTDWLEIKTPDGKKVWVSEQFVEILGNVQDIRVVTNLEPTPVTSSSQSSTTLSAFDLEGNNISGKVTAYQEQWYIFYENGPESVISLMFEPNVNLNANDVQFFIYDEHQIPEWPPKEADTLINIGAGSHPAHDIDGDLGNGELIWRGGSLQRDVRYYLRIINRSKSDIRYCLVPRDIYGWSCK